MWALRRQAPLALLAAISQPPAWCSAHTGPQEMSPKGMSSGWGQTELTAPELAHPLSRCLTDTGDQPLGIGRPASVGLAEGFAGQCPPWQAEEGTRNRQCPHWARPFPGPSQQPSKLRLTQSRTPHCPSAQAVLPVLRAAGTLREIAIFPSHRAAHLGHELWPQASPPSGSSCSAKRCPSSKYLPRTQHGSRAPVAPLLTERGQVGTDWLAPPSHTQSEGPTGLLRPQHVSGE